MPIEFIDDEKPSPKIEFIDEPTNRGVQFLDDSGLGLSDLITGRQPRQYSAGQDILVDLPTEIPKGVARGTEQTLGTVGNAIEAVGDYLSAQQRQFKDLFYRSPIGQRVLERRREKYVKEQGMPVDKLTEAPQTAGQKTEEFGQFISDYWNEAANTGWEKRDPRIYGGTFLENPSAARLVGGAAESTPTMLAAIGLSAAGQPGAGAALLAGTESLPMYSEAKKMGASEGDAFSYALLSGIGTAALERVGLDAIMGKNKVLQGLIKKMGRNWVAGAVVNYAAEGSQEALQEIWQNAVAMGYDGDRKLFEGALEAGLSGGLLGSAASVSRQIISDHFAKQAMEVQDAGQERGGTETTAPGAEAEGVGRGEEVAGQVGEREEAQVGGPDAIQEREAEAIPTREEAQVGEEVGQEVRREGEAQEEVAPDDIIGFSTEKMNEARVERGEAELTEEEVKSHRESMERALESGQKEKADDLAQRVIESQNKKKVLQMSDEEVAGMGARIVELRNERAELFAEQREAMANEDQDAIDNVMAKLEQNARKADSIEQALKTSGTASGRANSMMASMINRFTYDVVSLEDAARTAKGSELTAGERADIMDVAERIKEIEDQIADIKHQMKTGKFEETKKRKRKDEPAELTDAKRKLHQIQREARQKLYNLREKGWRDHLKMVATLPRTMIATADMSYGLRQGLIPSLGHPRIAARSWREAFKSFWSQNKADEVDVAMREHPMYDEIVGYGTHFSNMDSAISNREEFFASSIAEKIPGFGAVVRASERNMVTGLNMLRFGLMQDFLIRHPDASSEAKKAYARYVNIVTGRGQGKMLDRSAEELSLLFFAPRFAFSRVQAPYEAVKNMKHPELRGEIVRQWSSLLVTGMTILALAKAAGHDVGDDPEDSDWGKIVIDDKIRIDIFGGLQQPLRILAKTIKGGYQYTTSGSTKVNPIVDIGNFLKYKLSPPIMMANELITGEDVIGRDIEPIEAFGVEMPKSITTFMKNVTPLVIQSAAEAYQEELDPMVIAGLAVGEGLGLSIGVYDKGNKKKKSRGFGSL